MVYLNIRDDGGERRFDLLDAVITIGRAPENMIILSERECSRRQAQIERTEGGFKLVDLESRNGTRVNGRFVNQHLLAPGDRVEIGKAVLSYVDPDRAEAVPETKPAPLRIASAPHVVPTPAPSASDPGPAPKPDDSAVVRRRRGGTTSLTRASRSRPTGAFERERERRLIRNFAVGAVVFFILIFGMIFVGSLKSPGPPDYSAKELSLMEAEKSWEENPEYWRKEMVKITSEYGDLVPRAQKVIRDIDEHLKATAQQVSGEEKKLFDDLYEYRRKHPISHAEIAAMCQDFLDRFPASQYAASVSEFLKEAKKGKRQKRDYRIAQMAEAVDSLLRKDEYASAMLEVKGMLKEYGNDVDAYERIVRKQEEVMQASRSFFDKKVKEADGLKAQGRKDDAKQVYRETIEALGSERVEELRDLCRRARAKFETVDD